MEFLNSIMAELGLGGLALIMVICRAVGKSIPDSATGAMGILRRACKLLGLYEKNQK